MSQPGPPFYVISGCSGSGQSTLLDALARRGEAVVPEPGRRVVQEELRAGGRALPWEDAQAFVDRCAETARADLERCNPARRTFFDRSLVDVACAVERSALRAPAGLAEALAARPYARPVFLSRPRRALFRPDAERRHGFEDAVAEYEALVPAYEQRGHEPIPLPEGGVEERAAFVLVALEGG